MGSHESSEDHPHLFFHPTQNGQGQLAYFSPKTGAGDLRAAGQCIGYFIACYLSIVIVIVLVKLQKNVPGLFLD